MAKLSDKEGIEVLQMKWNSGEIADENILEMLEPSRMPKELIVRKYGGAKFPTWTGNPLFSNMVMMMFVYCSGSRLLPPLE